MKAGLENNYNSKKAAQVVQNKKKTNNGKQKKQIEKLVATAKKICIVRQKRK